MEKRSAENKASIGMAAGTEAIVVSGLCLFRAVGYADASSPETWIAKTVTLIGCVCLPAGAIAIILSFVFWAVHRKGNK